MNPSTSEQQYYKQMLNTYNSFSNVPMNCLMPNLIFYYEWGNNSIESKQKQTTTVGVQTESLLQEDSPIQSMSNLDINLGEKKEFPLPNKQKLFQIFDQPNISRKDIRPMIQRLCSKETKLLNGFYKSVGDKILSFKKTKEEIIKFLIRKAWKKQKVGANEAREKYYSEYKSMNSAYLTKIFSEKFFTQAFEQMLKNFDTDFEAFNKQRFDRFYDYLLNCYVKNNLAQFKASKQCKSKLPYPHWWKEEILEIANNLYVNYCQKRRWKNSDVDFDKNDADVPICETKSINSKK